MSNDQPHGADPGATEPVRLDKPEPGPWGTPAGPPTTPSTAAAPHGAAYGSPYGQQPPAYGSPYGQRPPQGTQPYVGFVSAPDHPQASTAVILGAVGMAAGLSLGIGFLLSPFAWRIGAKAVREIDASQGRVGGRGQAEAGRVMGLVGTVFLVLGIAGMVVLISVFAVGFSATSP